MKKISIILSILIILGSIIILLVYKNGISKVSDNDTIKEFGVKQTLYELVFNKNEE